jgi:hypothetical protein
MFYVKFRYKDGSEGVCTENAKPIAFETESEAADFAKEKNDNIDADLKNLFPVWFPVIAHEERNGDSK